MYTPGQILTMYHSNIWMGDRHRDDLNLRIRSMIHITLYKHTVVVQIWEQ
jgi:hypothetical protein